MARSKIPGGVNRQQTTFRLSPLYKSKLEDIIWVTGSTQTAAFEMAINILWSEVVPVYMREDDFPR
jgi:hypothetical protein